MTIRPFPSPRITALLTLALVIAMVVADGLVTAGTPESSAESAPLVRPAFAAPPPLELPLLGPTARFGRPFGCLSFAGGRCS